MRIWIICSGEAALALPPRAAAAEYAALCEKRLDSPVGETQGHPVAANGRGLYISPRAAARDTAEKLIADGMPQAEPLLDEIPLRPFGCLAALISMVTGWRKQGRTASSYPIRAGSPRCVTRCVCAATASSAPAWGG